MFSSRKYLSSILLLFLTQAVFAAGQTPSENRFGLGIVLGSPTAITGKYWTTNTNALDFGLAMAPAYSALVYGDYFWHWPAKFGHSNLFVSQLIPYIGVGGGIFSWNNGYYYGDRPTGWRNDSGTTGLYGRVPFGIEWYPTKPSIGVFIELVPSLAVIPGMWLFFDSGLGIRYYF